MIFFRYYFDYIVINKWTVSHHFTRQIIILASKYIDVEDEINFINLISSNNAGEKNISLLYDNYRLILQVTN